MEPVPETERLEEFRTNPTPSSLRLKNPASVSTFDLDSTRHPPLSPSVMRRSTDPIPSSPTSPGWAPPVSLPYRPRTTSPLSGAHSRSRSAAGLSTPLSRTRSLPGVNGSGHILARPGSPSTTTPARVRVPRKHIDEAFPSSPVRASVLDRENTPSAPAAPSAAERTVLERNSSPNLPTGTIFSRANGYPRRPNSPLRHASSSSTGALPTTPSSSSASSPMLRGHDSAGSWSYAASFPSSVPSTPTSLRSRSPSISSLETIPDSPDAEEEALEVERIAQLKAAADAAENDSKGRTNLDVPNRGRTLSFGSRDKRKRWSVCGAERRGDIDLETIWED